MDAINLEVRLFLSSVLWGIGLVILYDCLRIFRRTVKHNKIWAGLEDVLYWTVCAVLIFRMMYRINDGAIRGFAIVGVVIGMVLYHYSVSEFFVQTITLVIHKCIYGVKKTIQFIMKPAIWLSRRFRWIIVFLVKPFGRPFRFVRKALKKRWKQVKIAVVKK
ncbi:MAG TPA: spore cortex biosynthesis protein YabQ [Lachnospiraceae bacterium]|nr:spore cortex biosynthesis protein YabQ [uncultured Lachnoclostridium sp.]HAU87894.1 spore cortex biosynthesis protein YabQ [Lachnospiraceae bacterium]